MFYSYLLYIGVFLWLLLCALLDFVHIKKPINNFLFLSSLFLLVCLAGFRIDTGSDSSSYAHLFQESSETLFSTNYTGPMELGIVFLSQFVKALTGSQIAFFFSLAAIQGWFIWKAIHSSSYKKSILLIFFGLFYFALFFNILRQGVAIGFFCAFCYAYHEKKYIQSGLWALLGFLFHSTILVILILFFLSKHLKTSAKHLYTYLGIAIGLSIILAIASKHFDFSIISNSFDTLANSDRYQVYDTVQSYVNWAGPAILSGTIFFFLLFATKSNTVKDDWLLKLAILGNLLQILLIPLGPVIGRFALYFLFFLPIVFGKALNGFPSKKERNWFYRAGIFLAIAVFFYGLIKDTSGILPYHFALAN